jgi:cell division septal protein FtsQ
MKYLLIIFFALLFGCSSQKEANIDSINIKISKEIISNFDQVKLQITNHLQNKNKYNKSEIFSNSWVSVIKATKTFDEELHIELKEHQPIASLDRGRFITQEGKIITPAGVNKSLKLVSIIGTDNDHLTLLDSIFSLQDILNLKGNSLVSIEHRGSGFMEAVDNESVMYRFNKKDFRVQLERLEELILFELNSGINDDIRYIDLRYKNAIALGNKNMEKSI